MGETAEKVSIYIGTYGNLVRESEQLRILKNFTKAESTITKNEIINLINAMEVEQ